MRNSIDLRKEFDEFATDYGFPVLLHRAGRRLKCRCWSEKHMEADQDCPICGGIGWVSRIERHMVRRESAVQIISRPGMQEQTPLGKVWTDAQNFMMRFDSHPKPGDFIYEVGWTGNKPTHLIHAYSIQDVNQMRGDRGRIEYWNVAARTDSTTKKFKNVLVRSIGSIKNYEIVK